MSSSSGNASGSSSVHENDGKHPTSPADTEEDKHKRSHGNRSRDKSCNHGHHKQGHHKHHKCHHHHHHHKHKKHRSRSRSQENKTIVTVVKDSSSASEGEGEKTQSGAKSRSARKSKNRSKGRGNGSGQQSPVRSLVTNDTLVASETMAFENKAFNSDNEGLSDGVKMQETEFNGRKPTRDREFDGDEIFWNDAFCLNLIVSKFDKFLFNIENGSVDFFSLNSYYFVLWISWIFIFQELNLETILWFINISKSGIKFISSSFPVNTRLNLCQSNPLLENVFVLQGWSFVVM